MAIAFHCPEETIEFGFTKEVYSKDISTLFCAQTKNINPEVNPKSIISGILPFIALSYMNLNIFLKIRQSRQVNSFN